jgi:hypothetical protein
MLAPHPEAEDDEHYANYQREDTNQPYQREQSRPRQHRQDHSKKQREHTAQDKHHSFSISRLSEMAKTTLRMPVKIAHAAIT